ncbi:MAG: 3-hydroxydecanoyl-ACP dehydratase [Gammaproteobacteria bacterium]|nr:3-hydroxydecanoyl-ACP dehydratase [Gammaproteobacteria bacterium]
MSKGVLEVEGSDDLVREIFQSFKVDLKAHKGAPNIVQIIEETPDKSKLLESAGQEQPLLERSAKSSKKANTGKVLKKPSYHLIKTLNTGIPGSGNSVQDYLEKYKPSSNLDRNVVFTKYLTTEHPDQKVNLDAIFTCYMNTGVAPPGSLYQSVADTSKSKYGYLDAADMQDIKIVYKGEVLLQNLSKKGLSSEPRKV